MKIDDDFCHHVISFNFLILQENEFQWVLKQEVPQVLKSLQQALSVSHEKNLSNHLLIFTFCLLSFDEINLMTDISFHISFVVT